jgi:hypothetical protein
MAFTGPSLDGHSGRAFAADDGVMNEKTIETIKRQIRLVFMGAVTVLMLALTFEQAHQGLAAVPTTVVYALTVGFGLEFLGAIWTGGWRDRAQTPLDNR